MVRKGYRKKPKYIYVIGLFYFLVPFITLLQLSMNVGHDMNLLKALVRSDFYLQELFFAFTAGIAVVTVTRPGFFYLIVLSVYTLGMKFFNLQYNSLFEYPLDFFVLFFWFMMTILFLFTALRTPYLNPQARWWKQAPRYRHTMYGKLTVKSFKFPITTLNISRGGVFLVLDENAAKQEGLTEEYTAQFPKTIDREVELEIVVGPEAKEIFEGSKFCGHAKVAWVSKEKVPYKCGLGLEFIRLSAQDKMNLKKYMKFLKSQNQDLKNR